MMQYKFFPDDIFTQSHQKSTEMKIYGRDVDKSIGLDIVLNEGYLDVTVRDQNSSIVYQATVLETSQLVVEVPERGMYQVCLDLFDFTGSYTIDWSN